MAVTSGHVIRERFRAALGAHEGFLCLACAAAEIQADASDLSDCALKIHTWIGYSFAAASCGRCGDHTYCAIATAIAEA